MQATASVVTSNQFPPTRSVVVAQLTLANSQTSAQCAFGTQGRSVGHTNAIGGTSDWEENCIQVMVGGTQNGWGTHATNPQQTLALPTPSPAPPTAAPVEVLHNARMCAEQQLGPLQYGRWVVTGTDYQHQQAEAQCLTGYAPAGGNAYRLCTIAGIGADRSYQWTPGGVFCQSTETATYNMACPPVETDPYGTWETRTTAGSTVSRAYLVCNDQRAPVVSGNGFATSQCDSRGSDAAPPHWEPPFRVSGKVRAACPGPSAPAPTPQDGAPADPGGGGGTFFKFVLLLLLGGGVYVAKVKGLGPFAAGGAAKSALVAGPGESTIYDTGGDETL